MCTSLDCDARTAHGLGRLPAHWTRESGECGHGKDTGEENPIAILLSCRRESCLFHHNSNHTALGAGLASKLRLWLLSSVQAPVPDRRSGYRSALVRMVGSVCIKGRCARRSSVQHVAFLLCNSLFSELSQARILLCQSYIVLAPECIYTFLMSFLLHAGVAPSF